MLGEYITRGTNKPARLFLMPVKRISFSGLMLRYAASFSSGLCLLQKRFPSSTLVRTAPSADTLLITTLASCTRGECLISNAGRCESLVTLATRELTIILIKDLSMSWLQEQSNRMFSMLMQA